MDGLFWPLVLILIGVVLLGLEFFVPSAGALGAFAALAFLAAIAVGFYQNLYAGASSIVMVAVIIPVFLAVFVHFWPRTSMGKNMLLQRDESTTSRFDEEEEHLRTLIGKRGRAKTKMLPSGAVTIDGQIYDADSGGLPLEPGQPIEVIAMRFKRLVVRPVENDAQPRPVAEAPNVLAQPAEQFGISPFEDPLI